MLFDDEGNMTMRLIQILIFGLFVAASTIAYAAGDKLEEYTEKCEQATGIKVRSFNCDEGTKVPTTVDGNPSAAKYRPATDCDRPNVLNHECDPGSRFQVLGRTEDAVVVAHCRKQGLSPGEYGDIAIIQHNYKNGATCFYQALAEWVDDKTREKVTKPLNGKDVKAPSDGTKAWPWFTPAQTAAIGCGGCHDNGPIIRSPYLTQITEETDPPKKNILRGAGDYANGPGTPYAFVGEDFSSWKAYAVQVKDSQCTLCHRLGVSHVKALGCCDLGTARDMGLIATAASQAHKKSHSANSPLWMIRDIMSAPQTFTTTYNKANEDAAKEIAKCATRITEWPLPTQDDCTITQFSGSKMAAVRWQGDAAYFFQVGQYRQYNTKTNQTVEPSYPTTLKGKGLWASGVDAAVLWGNGKAYLFKGKDYLRYDVKTDKADPNYPKRIADHWPGVWAEGVDAAVPWINGKVYFFRGDQYIQYDVAADKADAGYPKPIKGNWPGLWADGIDTGIQWNENKAYFFKGTQYVRYDVKAEKVDPGYPKPIKGNWPGMDW
jgi:hypothetical protein